MITGESAPVIRESGGDRSAVTGGTKVLSDQIKIRITSNPGETFLDRMIALVEGAERQKTPNEIALNILIAGLTLIFLLAVVTLVPYRHLQRRMRPAPEPCPPSPSAGLPARLPDPHDHRRPAFGHRHRRHGPGDAAQRAGDERKSGGGRRRREHAAAGQDRHHHAGQPPGGRVPPGQRRDREGARRRRPAVQPGRRDARRPVDRGPGEGEVWAARPRHVASTRRTSSRSPPTRG